jgi:hypothetical protein
VRIKTEISSNVHKITLQVETSSKIKENTCKVDGEESHDVSMLAETLGRYPELYLDLQVPQNGAEAESLQQLVLSNQ